MVIFSLGHHNNSNGGFAMKRFMHLLVIFVTIVFNYGTAKAQDVSVFYECDELPGPWNIFGVGHILGPGNYQHMLEINNGILEMKDPDTEQFVELHYVNPIIEQATNLYIEASVKITSHNGRPFTPYFGMCSFDPERHFYAIAVLWYLIDLYPDKIEFLRINHYEGGYDTTVLGTYPVLDLNETFHTIILFKHESGVREFVVYVDGTPVFEVTNETVEIPLNAVCFGCGAPSGIGESEWDHVYFETTTPVSTDQSTWGEIKRSIE